VASSGPSDFIPITKKTITYIVAAVLVNEDNEVNIYSFLSNK
jgi:hypothetical protein